MALCLIHNSDVMSDLLTIREKGVLVSLLKPRCQLIKSTVAQVLQASSAPGEEQSWDQFDSGVLCLLKEESASSYFLSLYCVKKAELLWEQDLRLTSEYTVSRPYFHTFLAGAQSFGFNFANDDEAEEFYLAVTEARGLRTNQMRRNETTASSSTNKEPNSGNTSEVGLDGRKDFPAAAKPSMAHDNSEAFVDLDPAIERVLVRAGLSKDDLKNRDVTEAVDLIFARSGGVKAVEQELRKAASQTLPRPAGGLAPKPNRIGH
ncbi:neural Wiskott-Aldrich syndrome protein-like [Oryzias latipes]|uniref:neural Wiskott-Aldrich syndrome protein-like n=1 Tax=Oryzias latipes TaxID=8090 RepID=UPI0002A49722|nr:neural Wiskott-Aldrich syndrome protein-like [Oryzias latipes]XP_023810499.1 neural Wiskott-Aldrich syndrome protein-like [Oryzias latipes]